MDKTYHWAVKSPQGGPDYQADIDLSNSIFMRDTVLLYASQCGKFPTAGPHQVDQAWMTEHLNKIQGHLNTFIPDPNFSGLVVIDYEVWDLLWERTPAEVKAAWIASKGNAGEAGNKAAYDAAAKAFYVATFNRVKQLRPLAKVSFFGYPVKFYKTKETAPGVIGYGDGQYLASTRNNALEWLWQLEDFLSPNVYCLFKSVAIPNVLNLENTPDKDTEYIESNTKEAIRLAKGKPVYSVICAKYQREEGTLLHNQFLNGINIAGQVFSTINSGADGVILWNSIASVNDKTEYSKYFYEFIDVLARKTHKIVIDRSPIVMFIVSNGNWNSDYKPEYNPWGYSNAFRKDGVQGILNKMDEAIALGYRRLCIAKIIGTKPGNDVVAACGAMHPTARADWSANLPPWLAARKAQYPDLTVGFYTGSEFEKLDSLNCDPDSPNLKSAVDVSTPEALANFHGCHDFHLIDLKADFLIFDKGSTVEHGLQLLLTIPKFPNLLIISEAVRRQFERDIPMFARTTFWFQSNSDGISPDSTFDPKTTEIHWWLQQDYDVPAEGPALLDYVKKRQDQGMVVSCHWSFGSDEIISASKPAGGGWWHSRFIR